MAYPYYPYSNPIYQQPIQQTIPQQPVIQQTAPQIQNGGVVHATEEEARRYPVAPGYSVIFVDDDKKMLYTKTAGYGQLDTPKFEAYRLTKQEESASKPEEDKIPTYAEKAEFDALRAEFEELKKELKGNG